MILQARLPQRPGGAAPLRARAAQPVQDLAQRSKSAAEFARDLAALGSS